jgi:P4 family phage/plasmid primase-like protien
MIDPVELDRLKSYADIVDLAEHFQAAEIRQEGRRYRCCCLWHDERTGSLVLYPEQNKYHCYGCGAHGDVLSLVQQGAGVDFAGAVRWLARHTGYWPEGLADDAGQIQPRQVPAAMPKPRLKEDARRKWTVVTPVPARVPAVRPGTFEVYLHSAKRTVRPSAVWPYPDAAGQVLGYDVRYEYTKKPKGDLYRAGDLIEIVGSGVRARVVAVDGAVLMLEDGRDVLTSAVALVAKDVITWTWCQHLETGEQCWRMRAWDDPSPLYGLDRLAAMPDAPGIICEGCKAATAGVDLLPDMVPMSWRGGSDSATDAKRVDWSPLAGREVWIWPDADEPGLSAAWHIAQHLRAVGAASVRVVDPSGLAKGWDLADQADDPTDLRSRLMTAALVDEGWIAAHRPTPDEPRSQAAPALPQEPPAAVPPPRAPDAQAGSAGAPEGPELRNELADAARFASDVEGTCWYCPQRAANRKGDVEAGWLVWDGRRLRPSEDGAILRLVRDTALALSAEAVADALALSGDIREAVEADDRDRARALKARQARAFSRADALQSEARMQRMLSLARIDERLVIDGAELDADPDLLNTQNGIVYLPTGELMPHHPRHRCTRIAAVPYLPEADRSALDQLLVRACQSQQDDGTWAPDPDRIRYLQDAIGQGLYGHQRLQKFYLCLGKGGDGKGTLFEALRDALGGGHDGYAMTAAMQSFVREKVGGHRIRDDLANMAGARLVFASEINKGDALDGALVKTLSGEDTQRVRHLFGKEFEFRPVCTLFFIANHEPYVDSQDHAIWRRLVKIPFGPPLREDERDPAIRQALHDADTGGAALLAWAIEGAVRTHNIKRIVPCPSVEQATDAYRSGMNPLAGFLIEDLRFAPDEKASVTWVAQRAIRLAFDAWISESGLDDRRGGPGISGKQISQQLRDCGAWPGSMRIQGKPTKIWQGVTLRADHSLHDEHCRDPGNSLRDSWVPQDEVHQAVLAAAGLDVVTALPHFHSAARVGENKMPRAHAREIIFSPRVSSNGKCGNTVTEEKKETDFPSADLFADEPPF